MIDRLISFLVALSLASLVWLYARSRDLETLDNVPVPVQITLGPGQAEHYDLEITGPSQVPVSFTGPPSRLRELRRLLQEGEVRVEAILTVPEDRQNESRYLDTVRVDPADIPAPPGVTPAVVEGRNRIPVTLHRLAERLLPVRFDPAAEDRLAQATVEPRVVLVRGPEEVLEHTRAVPTQSYVLPPHEDTPGQEVTARARVPLVRELEGRPVRVTPDAVQVRFTFRPRQKVYELTDVPVRFLCPEKFPLRAQFVAERAGKVTVKVVGPAGEIQPAVVAFIDLTGGKFEPGLYADEPLRLQLPKDFQLAQEPPRSAAFELLPADTVRTRDAGATTLRGPN